MDSNWFRSWLDRAQPCFFNFLHILPLLRLLRWPGGDFSSLCCGWWTLLGQYWYYVLWGWSLIARSVYGWLDSRNSTTFPELLSGIWAVLAIFDQEDDALFGNGFSRIVVGWLDFISASVTERISLLSFTSSVLAKQSIRLSSFLKGLRPYDLEQENYRVHPPIIFDMMWEAFLCWKIFQVEFLSDLRDPFDSLSWLCKSCPRNGFPINISDNLNCSIFFMDTMRLVCFKVPRPTYRNTDKILPKRSWVKLLMTYCKRDFDPSFHLLSWSQDGIFFRI